MKINFIFIFLLISLFSFSAMEKASVRYSSEISEVDLEFEFEFEFEIPESDSIAGNGYVLYFVDFSIQTSDFKPRFIVSADYQSIWRGIDFPSDSSLNPIYYPHGPPALV